MFETSTIVETQSKMSRCKVGNLLDIKKYIHYTITPVVSILGCYLLYSSFQDANWPDMVYCGGNCGDYENIWQSAPGN